MYKGGTYSHVPAYSMGPKSKGAPANGNPGPGNYELPGSFGWKSSANYSFGKGVKNSRANGVPGPGSYDVGTGSHVKGAQDRDARFSPSKSWVPGPGSYDNGPSGKVGHSFGRQKRETPVRPAGPDYEIPHSIPDVAGYNYPAKDSRKIHI
jgi:hypothetical protein